MLIFKKLSIILSILFSSNQDRLRWNNRICFQFNLKVKKREKQFKFPVQFPPTNK